MKIQTYCEVCTQEAQNRILSDEINKVNTEYAKRQEFIKMNKYLNKI